VCRKTEADWSYPEWPKMETPDTRGGRPLGIQRQRNAQSPRDSALGWSAPRQRVTAEKSRSRFEERRRRATWH
jgi:hypothetical protein